MCEWNVGISQDKVDCRRGKMVAVVYVEGNGERRKTGLGEYMVSGM